MHILIIEDNPDLVANVYDFFGLRGDSIDVAYDALTGMKFAVANRYDAIVLDLTLPGGDGLQLCRRLRNSGYAVPVLMLTARDSVDDKLSGFAAGADDYLVKPFSLRELAARLEALVRRNRHAVAANPLVVADLSFDPATLCVTRAGKTIELPRIPLKMLELLMRRSPGVVHRDELERAVWGDSPPDSNALRAHIHLLRNAIDGNREPRLLHTVRGIGYRIAAPKQE